MKMKLIYPTWPKLERQTAFHLPPHGPIVFAAALPPDVEVTFVDENREEVTYETGWDVVAVSAMLTCQLPRAFAIADRFRELGVPVIAGGIAVTLHAEEMGRHADAVFMGEAEGHILEVIGDLKSGSLKPLYNHLSDPPDIATVGTARRDLLNRPLYNYRGVQMLDLVHASRGCRFNCFPCCNGYLGGSRFRPRPIDRAIAEMASVDNNRLFVVDNSLAQDKAWITDLFREMIPLGKSWVSHPILDDDEVLDLAARAGCWYVYQAVFDTSDVIRNRIKRLRDHGIGVEATVILGTDDHDEDAIRRLIDFLMEIELDIAEFTVMTPFPHSPIRKQLEDEGRILSNDWLRYTCDKVVFQPKLMTPEKLQEMYYWAWDTFYAGSGYQLKMAEMFRKVIMKEAMAGTYRRSSLAPERRFRGDAPRG